MDKISILTTVIWALLIAWSVVSTAIAIWFKRKSHNLERDLTNISAQWNIMHSEKDRLRDEVIYQAEKLENAFFRCSSCGKFLKKDTVQFGEFQKPYCNVHIVDTHTK